MSIVLISASVIFLLAFSCTASQLKIGASIFPVYDYLSNVADEASIQLILPPGTDPHHYELGPKDIIKLKELDLVFYVGLGVEYWLENPLKLLDAERVICLSEGLVTSEKGALSTAVDYHIWLDPVIAGQMVEKIRDVLITVDPGNKEEYIKTTARYVAELEKLHQEYQKALGPWLGQTMIVSHAAFGYLAERYGLTQLAVTGVSAEDQPSARKLADLVKQARKMHCKAIFYEPWGEQKTMGLLAGELGVTPLELHPLGTIMPQELGQRTYLSIMRDNLQSLVKGFSGGK
ncbi:MAG: zinc ABC transporter substrate-binding protein [Limnochordia bacterium]|jgi:zinc transport system substrate-binding protein|nr:zinc ABC transporter substrate-binding protein [Limnochordia bacterium]MDD2629513.1 zinc ABC transporter substrate-binding protein [Limnochordia bacterium]MDD4517926.1 zinc ABC transporter substrate-binding protein [Limnochordia bacterium]